MSIAVAEIPGLRLKRKMNAQIHSSLMSVTKLTVILSVEGVEEGRKGERV